MSHLIRRCLLMSYVLSTALLAPGCQRVAAPPPSVTAPTVTTATTAAAPLPDLATRLKSLSTDEQNSLRELLVPPRATIPSGDARLVAIARELCHLTLAEANQLGIRLDAEQAGTVSEFALVPLRRQTWALDQVQQIQARMTKKISPQYSDHVWFITMTTANRDLAWLKDRSGANVTEMTTLVLVHEPDDLGPVPSDISDADLQVVAAFTGLQRLDLRETQISDAGLAHLAPLRQLQYLDLSNTAVSDAGLRAVAELSGLSELRLQDTRIAGPGIGHLARCTNLTKLIFTKNDGRASELNHLNRLQSLVDLQVSANGDLDLHDLPKLVKLLISQGGLKDRPGTIRLANMPALETADLNLYNTSNGRFRIVNLPKILRLRIRTDFRTFPFDQVGRLTHVRELILGDGSQPPCSETDVRHLGNLRHLTRLFLEIKLTPGCLQHLQHLTALRQLACGGLLDDAELLHLKNMKLLQVLTVWDVQGAGQGLQVLQQLPKLKELSLSRTKLDALQLTGLPSVLRLHFQKCRIGSLDISRLPNLQTVNIAGLTTESISVKDLPKIERLSFSLINADKIRQVSLQGLPALKTLKLVPITQEAGIEDIRYIANLNDHLLADVAKLPSLENLTIRFSAITDAGLEQLLSGPKIRWLEITGPNISKPAMQRLRKVLGSW